MRLAILGLGGMGHALAERLLAGGHAITVWNRTPDKASDLVAKGASPAGTPAEAAQTAEATFMSLTDDDAVRGVVCGPDGAAAGIGDGVLIDASTVSPETSAQVARAVSGRFLAAPILGGPPTVVSGEATYIIGGPHELSERVRPAFEALADEGHRRYVGEDPEVATTLKLLSNHLLLSGIAILAETVAAAQAAGLADDLISDYFRDLPLVAPALRNRLDDIVSREHTGWFAIRLGAKDLRLVEELARARGVPLPLAEAVKRRYERAMAEGWSDADIGAVVEVVRTDLTGDATDLPPTAMPPQLENGRRESDYAVALTRLFTEALNARDYESMRALVAADVELRGPNGSALRGYPAASELLEAVAHIDLVVVRTALEELEQEDGATRVTVPIRELIHNEELFRTAVFRVRDGAITSYETLGID